MCEKWTPAHRLCLHWESAQGVALTQSLVSLVAVNQLRIEWPCIRWTPLTERSGHYLVVGLISLSGFRNPTRWQWGRLNPRQKDSVHMHLPVCWLLIVSFNIQRSWRRRDPRQEKLSGHALARLLVIDFGFTTWFSRVWILKSVAPGLSISELKTPWP